MTKAEYTFTLDNESNLYACFGRTVKYIFDKDHWKTIENPDEYEFLFDYYSPSKIISYEEALKISNNIEPVDYYSVHKRVYLTEEEINTELKETMDARSYSETTQNLVMKSDLDTRVLVLEWLIRSPNLHELTIEMLVRNI